MGGGRVRRSVAAGDGPPRWAACRHGGWGLAADEPQRRPTAHGVPVGWPVSLPTPLLLYASRSFTPFRALAAIRPPRRGPAGTPRAAAAATSAAAAAVMLLPPLRACPLPQPADARVGHWREAGNRQRVWRRRAPNAERRKRGTVRPPSCPVHLTHAPAFDPHTAGGWGVDEHVDPHGQGTRAGEETRGGGRGGGQQWAEGGIAGGQLAARKSHPCSAARLGRAAP